MPDRLMVRFDSESHGDLTICKARGVAYQNTNERITYGNEYFLHYKRLEKTPTANLLNAGRCDLLARHAPAGCSVVDVGAGSGEFVRSANARGFQVKGNDINEVTVQALREQGLFADTVAGAAAVTFWDSLEHIPEPESVLARIDKGAVVCVAIPLVNDMQPETIRASKHYKPGEHLYHFTEDGFIAWMACYGFRHLETSEHEVTAGRESIGAYAFKRDIPGYEEHIDMYKEMHSTRFYGSSATELHLAHVAKVVQDLKPNSILDFGCGRSDLIAHFWRDGERRIARYDPAIPAVKRMPQGMFDLVLCCDVLEHIPVASVDRFLDGVRSKGGRAFFTISTRLARAKLPDGRNAHVTILTRQEWTRWIRSKYSKVKEFGNDDPECLLLLATS